MADTVKFPGTEMEVYEKHPDSRRLDHPNFGDVLKTPYAKGVITAFKVGDPPDLIGTIKSQVKVTGVWGESDYISLFYHPKKQYWDDPDLGLLATDYNKEECNFERAWMSFRCDDEVAVLLKENVPTAVIGFVDGKPKVGEDIIKVNAVGDNPARYYSASRRIINPAIDTSEIGPDNIKLNLTEQAKYYEGSSGSMATIATYESCGGGSTMNPLPPYNGWTDAQYVKNESSLKVKLGLWIAIVGPILYAFISTITWGSSSRGLYFYHSDEYEPAWNDWWQQSVDNPPCSTPPAQGIPYDLETGTSEPVCSGGIAKADIYTKKLLDDTIASFYGLSALGFYENPSWPGAPLKFASPLSLIPSEVNPAEVKLYFKPHND